MASQFLKCEYDAHTCTHQAQVGLTDRIFSRIQSRETCTVSHSSFGIDLNQVCSCYAARWSGVYIIHVLSMLNLLYQVSVMLRNSTPRSLLLIDEFGKGTQSTDGVALLASTIAHLDGRGAKCPRTIVATHFHELSLQRDMIPPGNRVGFFTMAVMAENARQQKQQNVTTYHLPEEPTAELVFLYRLVEGKSMSSHGYHCAIKAGMSVDLVSRAQQVMASFPCLDAPDRSCPSEVPQRCTRLYLFLLHAVPVSLIAVYRCLVC